MMGSTFWTVTGSFFVRAMRLQILSELCIPMRKSIRSATGQAANRKLGSDMADSVTGGGLHGKDLSKADVSVNIYAFLKAQKTGKPVTLCCAIGDNAVDGRPYAEIVEIARNYIRSVGGFEQFAEWGLV